MGASFVVVNTDDKTLEIKVYREVITDWSDNQPITLGDIYWHFYDGARVYWILAPTDETLDWLDGLELKFCMRYETDEPHKLGWVVWTFVCPDEEFFVKLKHNPERRGYPYVSTWEMEEDYGEYDYFHWGQDEIEFANDNTWENEVGPLLIGSKNHVPRWNDTYRRGTKKHPNKARAA